MSTTSPTVRDWRDPALPPSGIAERFVTLHADALQETGAVFSVPRLRSEVAGDFLERATAALDRLSDRAQGARCLAVFSPPPSLEEGPEFGAHTLREAEQEIAVRLSEDMFPLVIAFFDVYGRSARPHVYAVGEAGVSDRLLSGGRGQGWPEDFGDDFRVDPGPAVELATLTALAWLGPSEVPDAEDYEHDGLEAGDVSRYLGTHEPGGADAIVATSVLGFGGVGVLWFFSRRIRLSDQEVRDRAASAPTRIPASIIDRLPELLRAGAPAVDPQRATSPAGLDWAVALREAAEDRAVLAERISSRLTVGSVPTRTVTPRMMHDAVPPVEAAALVVLDAEVEARTRLWRRHLQHGDAPDPDSLPRFCAFNPFHGQTTLRRSVPGASASVDVPVCSACRDALGRDDAPDALRVSVGGRARGYMDVGDGYAESLFGAVRPLGPAALEAPASQPVGERDGAGSMVRGCLSLLVIPLLILLLAAVLGAGVSILLESAEAERFLTDAEQAERAAEAGPTIAGYPVLNALRGGAIGAIAALLFAGLGAVFVAFRSSGDGSAPGADASGADPERGGGYDPHRRSELENHAVQRNIRILRDGSP